MSNPGITSVPIQAVLETYRPSLSQYEDLYKHFHANPELSNQEMETASRIASHLRTLSPDLDIRTGIGGHGLVAILENGPGKTVLLRADMDALPVLEKTDLPYASKKRTLDNADGVQKPVSHVCGHDFHITSLLAATETLLRARETWSGTIVSLFQPAEERGGGAKSMVEDGLFAESGNRRPMPLPDVFLGQHVISLPAGTVTTKSGAFMSAADSFKVTIYGQGGHGSMPHTTIDPVVIASHIVVRLQTIVSRELPPGEIGVVTVGSLLAGSTENVISDEAVLKINIRTASAKWRQHVLAAVERIIRAECIAGKCPRDPVIESTTTYPLTVNDETVSNAIMESFTQYFGDAYHTSNEVDLGSEDFGVLSSAIGRPACYWFFGGHNKEKWDQAKAEGRTLPDTHSPFFAPAVQPTLQTGVDALVVAAWSIVGKRIPLSKSLV